MHARDYNPNVARFLSVDPVRGNPKRPQSFNLYAYVANNPINRVDPDGRNWFNIGGSWQYHEGAEWKDKDGKRYTSNFTHLLRFQKTGTNSSGATVGTLTLFNQNKAVATSLAFSGGNGSSAIPNGSFTIRLDIRGNANSSAALKPSQTELQQFYGIQQIAPSIVDNAGIARNARWEWGSLRAALNEPPGTTQVDFLGNYLHGKERLGDYTHGCICERSEAVLNSLFGLDPGLVPAVPVEVQ